MTREEFDKQSDLCFSVQENLFVCKDYINSLEQRIKELEESQKPKTCEGCKHSDGYQEDWNKERNRMYVDCSFGYIETNMDKFGCIYYEPKDKQND